MGKHCHNVKMKPLPRCTAILALCLSVCVAIPVAQAGEVVLGEGFAILLTDPATPALRKNLEILNRDIAKVHGRPAEVDYRTGIPPRLKNAVVIVNEEAGGVEGLPSLEGFERHRIYVNDGNLILHGADELGTVLPSTNSASGFSAWRLYGIGPPSSRNPLGRSASRRISCSIPASLTCATGPGSRMTRTCFPPGGASPI